MTKRTDIHRPSAIVTADYDFIGFMYCGPKEGAQDDMMAVRRFLNERNAKWSNHDHGGSCHVCGAHAMYLGVFHHRPTNTLICVGETCADKMDADPMAFRSFHERAKAGIDAFAGKAKARAALAERGLADAFDMGGIAGDIVSKLVRYGSISDKQWSFLGSLVERERARPAVEAAREVAKEVARATSRHLGAVGERRSFLVKVVATPKFEGQFGTVVINLCEDMQGNVVVYKGGKALGEKGQMINVKATIKAHGEREGVKQTIINRPVAA
jgi:hypothetical protein